MVLRARTAFTSGGCGMLSPAILKRRSRSCGSTPRSHSRRLPMNDVSWLPLVYEVAARFQAAKRDGGIFISYASTTAIGTLTCRASM